MDAVEFLEEQYRMCEALNSHCEECGLSYVNNKTDHVCGDFIKRHPEEAVAIVEKWAKEHPLKTRQSELLKIFPNARRWDNFIDLCPQMIEKFDCPQKHGMDNWKFCAECKGRYWNEEVE